MIFIQEGKIKMNVLKLTSTIYVAVEIKIQPNFKFA